MKSIFEPLLVRGFFLTAITGLLLSYLSADSSGCTVSNTDNESFNGYYSVVFGVYEKQNPQYDRLFRYIPSIFDIFENTKGMNL